MYINFVESESPDTHFLKYLDTSSGLLLDGGCGMGGTALGIATRITMEGGSARVIGIDCDEGDVEVAMQRARRMNLDGIAGFRVDDLTLLETFGDKTLNHAFMRNTACWFPKHFDTLKLILTTIAAKSAMGARLSILEQLPPALQGDGIWWRVWELRKSLRRLQGRTHLDEMDPGDLVSLVAEAGYTGIETAFFKGERIDSDITRDSILRLSDQCTDTPGAEGIMDDLAHLLDGLSHREYDFMPSTYVIHATLAKGR